MHDHQNILYCIVTMLEGLTPCENAHEIDKSVDL